MNTGKDYYPYFSTAVIFGPLEDNMQLNITDFTTCLDDTMQWMLKLEISTVCYCKMFRVRLHEVIHMNTLGSLTWCWRHVSGRIGYVKLRVILLWFNPCLSCYIHYKDSTVTFYNYRTWIRLPVIWDLKNYGWCKSNFIEFNWFYCGVFTVPNRIIWLGT